MDAGHRPSTSSSTRRPAGISVLPVCLRRRIWQLLVPTERKVVQAARRQHPPTTNDDRAPLHDYALTVGALNQGPKLPVLHIRAESRILLPRVFLHATVDDGRTSGIWWHRDVDVLFLTMTSAPSCASSSRTSCATTRPGATWSSA